MAQDSIAYVLIRDCNCSNCCNPSHLTEVVDYKVNTNDKSETEIICNTLILIVWIIVGTIILATIISAAKSLFESRIKRTLEIKKDQLRTKEDEMKRNEDENKQLKNQISKLQEENKAIRKWESRFADLENKLKE